MTPYLWFSVGMRLIGLWQLLKGMEEIFVIFDMAKGSYHMPYITTPVGVVPFVAFHLIAGIVLLKGAPTIAAWAYPNHPKTSE